MHGDNPLVAGRSSPGHLGRYASRKELILPVVVVLMFAAFGMQDARILLAGNLVNVLQQASFLFIFALAQTLVIVTRGFDLSLGPTVSLVSVGSALVMVQLASAGTSPPVIALAGLGAALAVGAMVGSLNGALVALTGVTPFIVTLGTFNIITGLATNLSGGHPVQGIPDSFTRPLTQETSLQLPAPVLLAAVAGVIVYLLLRFTTFGRSVFLVGANVEAAKVAGIPVRRVVGLVYILSSVLTALGAAILTARTGSGEPTLGGTLSLQSAAAAIVGGASFAGGVGGVATALLGAVFITVLSNGMNLLQVNGYLQMVVLGVIVIGGVMLDRAGGDRS